MEQSRCGSFSSLDHRSVTHSLNHSITRYFNLRQQQLSKSAPSLCLPPITADRPYLLRPSVPDLSSAERGFRIAQFRTRSPQHDADRRLQRAREVSDRPHRPSVCLSLSICPFLKQHVIVFRLGISSPGTGGELHLLIDWWRLTNKRRTFSSTLSPSSSSSVRPKICRKGPRGAYVVGRAIAAAPATLRGKTEIIIHHWAL